MHSFPKIYHGQAFIQEIPNYKLFQITLFKMKGKIKYESEFLTLIEDLVKLIIKSAIISLLSESLPKASTFVCSWSVSWYSDSQYLTVESQKTIF